LINSEGKQLISVLDFLRGQCGEYRGDGATREGEKFDARMTIQTRVDVNIVEVSFEARDQDSAFHTEITWIATDLMREATALWTVSSNMPGVLQHLLVEDDVASASQRKLVFQLGQLDNRHSFRQQITLAFIGDGKVEYRYGWGVPHQDFSHQNLARLTRLATLASN
jgi:hypothetical protein